VSRDFARHLRKTMTDAERRLWHHLKVRQLDGQKFRRQAPIGIYVVDFVCFESRLIVELDGGQHAERVEQDEVRTAWLASRGFRVIRFWNHQVFEDLEPVLEAIWNAVRVVPLPQPSPARGEGAREEEVRRSNRPPYQPSPATGEEPDKAP